MGEIAGNPEQNPKEKESLKPSLPLAEGIKKLFFRLVRKLLPFFCPELMCFITMGMIWLMAFNNFFLIKDTLIYDPQLLIILVFCIWLIGNIAPFIAVIFKVKLKGVFLGWSFFAAVVNFMALQQEVFHSVSAPYHDLGDGIVFFFAFASFLAIIAFILVMWGITYSKEFASFYDDNPKGLFLLALLTVIGNLIIWIFVKFRLSPPSQAVELAIYLAALITVIYKKRAQSQSSSGTTPS